MPASEMFRTLFFGLGAATLLVVVLAYGRPWLVPIAVAVLIWFLINALAQAVRNRASFIPGWAATTLSLLVLGLGALAVTQIIARNVGALTEGLTGADDRLGAAATAGPGPAATAPAETTAAAEKAAAEAKAQAEKAAAEAKKQAERAAA
ncbi:MAG: hypothetical protein ACK4WC_03290, partial [Rubrimonas sp.]